MPLKGFRENAKRNTSEVMFEILKKDARTSARVGQLHTKHGVIDTPAYAMVGTHGLVREMTSEDLKSAKTQVVIVNTYHLWQKFEIKKLRNFSGLHEYMGWDGPLMTDSGGFQVFSLGVAREQRVGKVWRPATSDK